MKAQVITTEYTALYPVQPWRHVVAAAASQGAVSGAQDGVGTPEMAAAAPRKASDRGASAVEWVIITGIVVAIVAGVGVIISKAITSKANTTCSQINGAGNNNAGGNGGGNAGTTVGTGNNNGGNCG